MDCLKSIWLTQPYFVLDQNKVVGGRRVGRVEEVQRKAFLFLDVEDRRREVLHEVELELS